MSTTRESSSIRTLLAVPKIVIDSSCDDAPMDKYTAGIELSNACRQFYVTRLKAAGKVKERLGLANGFATAKHECTEEPWEETKHSCVEEGKDGTTPAAAPSRLTPGGGNLDKRPPRRKSNIENKMNLLKHEMVSMTMSFAFSILLRDLPTLGGVCVCFSRVILDPTSLIALSAFSQK